jgi:hypothetical protein
MILLLQSPNFTQAITYSINNSLDEEKIIEINFDECKSDKKVIYVAFGSATYEIVEKKGKNCLINYGGEIENPNWDGFLSTTCSVPTKLGIKKFNITQTGVDFSAIKKYCKKRSKIDN